MRTVKYEPIPDYGDVMDLETFTKECEYGCFTDYDGFGNLANENGMSSIEFSPSSLKKKLSEHSDIKFTKVVWFNR